MKKIITSGEFFNPADTLECGQVFRFKPFFGGYLVFSGDKVCFLRSEGSEGSKGSEGEKTVIECIDGDEEYFYNYFDLAADYSKIVEDAKAAADNFGFPILKTAANLGKGVRILRQNHEEAFLSFIISQNNNIPRIKTLIERLCELSGEKKTATFSVGTVEYFSFPSACALAKKDESFYADLGFGYRARYMCCAVQALNDGFLKNAENFSFSELKNKLLCVKGVGEKVADCVCLFGFHKTASFPVDVWIERVYKQNFNGALIDRKKISEYFVSLFNENSGYFQQYLFYYKRSLSDER